ncbi:MAG TPA: T9SS type A sorting domain-containing protein [Candidatus Acidoferrales bacterium]|nr:T9SS type A sorting domain-containing protein [Candidatus Acidoferrales bacterium]
MKTRFVLKLVLSSILMLCAGEAFAQWSAISELQYVRISGILVINDSTIFIGGFNGAFLRSTDRGNTWSRVIPTGMGTDSIFSLNKCGGYLFAGTNAPVSLYRSSDNGNSWSAAGQGLPPNTNVNGMTYLNGVTYAATTNGVLGSTDNGTSWTADTLGLNLGPPPFPPEYMNYGTVGITSAGSNLYVIEALNGKGAYRTSADSISWTPIGLDSVSESAITSLDTNVFVATTRGIFLYSGGTAWLDRSVGLPFSDSASITLCSFATSDTLLFAYIEVSSSTFYGHEIYVTHDLGKTWIDVNDSAFAGSSVTAMVATPKYLFVGTQSGAWQIPISDVITSVNENLPPVPSKYVLYQNYPNPFNPSTVIGYRLPAASHVTLKVYDVMGREVKTLVNERQSAGSHSARFDAGSLPSGLYFYRIQAGNYSSTKKALLVK